MHPGELDESKHPDGTPNAITDVHIKRFPLSPEEVEALERAGGQAYDVSLGQRVIYRNGAVIVHGRDDGLK